MNVTLVALDMADDWDEVKPHLVVIATAIRDSLVAPMKFGDVYASRDFLRYAFGSPTAFVDYYGPWNQ